MATRTPQGSRLVDAGLSWFAVRQIYFSVLSRSFFQKSNMIPIYQQTSQNGVKVFLYVRLMVFSGYFLSKSH
ncbi:hypothetical protein [Nostoc sp. FACHB-888]|uniref:hypothetical protein n=1 Tax=Nostoc sp. FACHB-888 TaxID=2692842 RepID=UPI0019C623B8|nr:hypothetical protein [Nostoc sp. FACHB-888]MBD2243900.1 hypothetical protein [Nostoc sp. FACHB-888]